MQAMTEVPADPPLMKNAGHIPPYYAEGDGFGLIVLLAGFMCLVAGGMLLALMSSRRRTARGAFWHSMLGVLALAIVFVPLDYEQQVGTLDWGQALLSWTWPVVALWLLLGGLGFALGRVVKGATSA